MHISAYSIITQKEKLEWLVTAPRSLYSSTFSSGPTLVLFISGVREFLSSSYKSVTYNPRFLLDSRLIENWYHCRVQDFQELATECSPSKHRLPLVD